MFKKDLNKCPNCGQWSAKKGHKCPKVSPKEPKKGRKPTGFKSTQKNTEELSKIEKGDSGTFLDAERKLSIINDGWGGEGETHPARIYREAHNWLAQHKTPPNTQGTSTDWEEYTNKIITLRDSAKKYSETVEGYKTVILDAEILAGEGNIDRAMMLYMAAEQGRAREEQPQENDNRTQKNTNVTIVNMVNFEPPQDTFNERLNKYFASSYDLEDAKIHYEESRVLSNYMAYPLGVCINCTHVHEEKTTLPQVGNNQKSHITEPCGSCDCEQHYPADEKMNTTYEAYHTLAETKGQVEYNEKQLSSVYPGDRWVIAHGERVGQRCVSLKVHNLPPANPETHTTESEVSVITDNGENFWINAKNLTRDQPELPPGTYDP